MERDLRLKAEMPGKESEDSSGPGRSGGIPDSYATPSSYVSDVRDLINTTWHKNCRTFIVSEAQ